MKSQKDIQDIQKKKNNGKQKIWKIVAISVIAAFAVLVIIGIIKAHYIKSSFVKPTSAQISYATKIASDKLKSTGADVSSFQVQAGRKMHIMHDNGVSRTTIPVSFYNNSATHTYIIDINSGEVLLHSETNMHIPFGERQNKYPYDGHKPFEWK